jgi:hypothetical protein
MKPLSAPALIDACFSSTMVYPLQYPQGAFNGVEVALTFCSEGLLKEGIEQPGEVEN